MKKLLLSVSAGLVFMHSAQAQITTVDDLKKSLETTNKDTVAWMHGGTLTIGANEGFLHNWAAGGELASLTVNGIFSGFVNRLYHRAVWSNNLDMTYGLTYNYSTSFVPRKTDDRIDFTSKYGIRVDTTKNFYVTGLFNFKSQFTKGYDYSRNHWDSISTSKFFSPAYFTTAIGMEYRRGSDVSLFFSPVAGRLTLVDKYYTSMSETGAFGVPYNKTSLLQFGAYFSGRYVININKNTVFKTRLDLYSNYLAKNTKVNDSVTTHDSPANISFLFDNLLSWKVSKVFNISVGLTLMYDNNIPYSNTYTDATTGLPVKKNEPGETLGWLEVKQILTFGLQYKF